MSRFNATDFVDRVLKVNNRRYSSLTFAVSEEEILDALTACTALIKRQPVCIEAPAPMNIAGDIHGQYDDLLRIFRECGSPSTSNPYLFLGDYVDRGPQQLETMCLLVGYKLLFPDHFFLLRGNHECPSINVAYGFFDECKRRYSIQLYHHFQTFFSYLPVCALIGDRLFCMHGGLSPLLKDWSQLSDRRLRRPIYEPEDYSLASDLIWADPAPNILGWSRNSRGVSFVFGEDVVARFCEDMEIDLIVRAHQVVQDGYEFFANRRLVTVFSAPRYCGEEDNLGAVMNVSANLRCEFTTIWPTYRARSIRKKRSRTRTPVRD